MKSGIFSDIEMASALSNGHTASWEFLANAAREIREHEFNLPADNVDWPLLAIVVTNAAAQAKRITTEFSKKPSVRRFGNRVHCEDNDVKGDESKAAAPAKPAPTQISTNTCFISQ